MRSQKMVLKMFIGVFILALIPRLLWAGAPEGLVKEATDRILAILRDPSLKVTEKSQERRQKVWEEILAVFDFEEMSKRAMGRYWRKRSLEEKKEFVDLFSHIVQDAYIGKIDLYSGEEVVYLGEKQDNHYATVQTKIITNTGTDVTVDYRLLDEQGKWMVYDVIIEGVSLVNNYRTQFNSILVKSSYDELVGKMRQKKEEKKVSAK